MSVVRIWTKWAEAAGKMPLRASILAGVAMLLAAALLDWLTGPELASAIFYLAPILWMSWKAGRWPGVGMAVCSGVTWLVLVLTTHRSYPNTLIPLWNAFVRTISFCLVSGLLSEMLERRRLEARVRQARADLAKQAGILQSVLDSMGDGVVVVDSQGRLLHMNPAARRTLRIPAEDREVVAWLESQENYLPDFVPGQSTHENPLLRAVRGETVDEAEMFLPRADSPEGIWLSITGRPLRDPAGRITGGVIVFGDISARKKLERQIAEASDREQRRLGEDLHDGLCQHLVSTAFAARRLAAKLGDRSLPEAEDAAEIAELLGAAISQARDVSRGLCLVPLEAGGLASALEEFATQVRSRHRIACQFVEQASIPALEETVGTNLFRIAQEAVNNAIKHGQARQITVTLSADPRQIWIEVEDDGIGFRAEVAPGRGMGLHMMNYRARMVAAAFNIGPRAGGGTTVTCSVRRSNLTEENIDAHGERD
jgi:two-component system sensor kinase FixL